jgi:hypothetical protein
MRVVFVPEFKIKLCVKSIKTVAGTREAEHEILGRHPTYPIRIKIEGKGDYVFPEDQQKLLKGLRESLENTVWKLKLLT